VRLEDNNPGLRVVLVLSRRCVLAAREDDSALEVAAS
jgi:hypothetical protein